MTRLIIDTHTHLISPDHQRYPQDPTGAAFLDQLCEALGLKGIGVR